MANEFQTKDFLSKIERTNSFQNADEQGKQAILRESVGIFLESSQGLDEGIVKNQAKEFNESRLRQLGLGRHQNTEASMFHVMDSLPDNFQELSKHDQVEELNKVKSITPSLSEEIDFLNSSDLEFEMNSILTQTERQIRGEDTGPVADKFYRAADGLINSFVGPFDSEEAQKLNRELFPENPIYDESFVSQLSFGLGDFAGQTAAFVATSTIATPAAGTSVLFGANASRRFQENYQTSKALGLDDDMAVNAGIASLPGSVIDSLGDRLIAGKFLPNSARKKVQEQLKNVATNSQKIKIITDGTKEGIKARTFQRGLRDAVAEGLSEAAGDFAGGYGGYLVTGAEEFVPSAEDLSTSFGIGAILGGGASVIAGGVPQDTAQFRQISKELGGLGSIEEIQQDLISKFEKGDLPGALKVLQEFKKQQEGTQEDVDARTEQIQEIQGEGESQRQAGQPAPVTGREVDEGSAPAPQKEGDAVRQAEQRTSEGDQADQVTNQLVRAIAGDTSVEAELDTVLPQRKIVRDEILGAEREGIEEQTRRDALTLLDTAIVKASQASGVDPAQAYQALQGGAGFRIAQSKKERNDLRKQGHAVLRLDKTADVSTLHHELGHIFRVTGILSNAIGPELNASLEQEFGVEDGNWTEEQEERFTTEYENFLNSGEVKSDFLRDVFNRVRDMFRQVYVAITGADLSQGYVSQEVIDAVNELYNIDTQGIQQAVQLSQTLAADLEARLNQATEQGGELTFEEIQAEVNRARLQVSTTSIDNQQAFEDELIRAARQELVEPIDQILRQGNQGDVSGFGQIGQLVTNLSREDISEFGNGINWDVRGIGSVPFQVDINYFGFSVPMTHDQFRKIVPEGVSGPDTKSFIKESVENGESIAPPFLQVTWDEEGSRWTVNDHEGRSRADTSNELFPNELIPVSFIPSNKRARSITDEMVSAPIVPQDGGDAIILRQGNQGDVSGFGQINQPATNQSVTPEQRPSPVSYEEEAEVGRAIRFIRQKAGKFENSEDNTLAGQLLYLGRNIPIAIRRGLIENDIPTIIGSVRNFELSRNRRRGKGIEQRFATHQEIEEMSKIRDRFDSEFAESLYLEYRDVIEEPFTGDRNDLDEVRDWILRHSPNEEGSKGPSPAPEEWVENLRALNEELFAAFPTANNFLNSYESFNGEINNRFKLRDDYESLIGQTFNHLQTLDYDNLTHRDAIASFLMADAFLNIQVPNFSRIGDAAYREGVTEGALERKDTWAERFHTHKFTKVFSNPVERADVRLRRVSHVTETQRFFQNVVFGKLDTAVTKMEAHYRHLLKEYGKVRDAHFEKIDGSNITKENIFLTIALKIRQISPMRNRAEDVRGNFEHLRKSITNFRKKKDRSELDEADQIEKVLNNLQELVQNEGGRSDLSSPNLYEDLQAALPKFLTYDGIEGTERIEYMDQIVDIFDSLRAPLKLVTEGYRGPFQDFVNYAPTHAVSVSTLFARDSDVAADAMQTNEDFKVQSSKSQVSEVKRRTGIGEFHFYDFNLDRVIPRQILGALTEIYTTPVRFELAKILDPKHQFAQTVSQGNQDTIDELNKTIVQLMKNALRRGESVPGIIRGMNTFKSQLAKIHLGSVGKLFTEPSAAFTHYFARRLGTGHNTLSNLTDALNLMRSRWGEYWEFVQEYNPDLASRSAAGEVELDKRELTKLKKTLLGEVAGKVNKVTDLLFLPLKIGDGIAAHTIFLTEYITMLKQTGQANDHTDVDFSKPDFELMARSNRFMEEFVGLSGGTRRAPLFSDANVSTALIRNLLFSYTHHLSQLGQQLQRDIVDIVKWLGSNREDQIQDKVRDAAGIIGQIGMFSAVRFATVAGMSVVISNLIKDIFDDEEGKLAELQKKIDEAVTPEEKELARQEYQQARIIRDIINKFERRSQSPDSLFKSIVRDELTGIHIIAGAGEGFIPRVLIMGQFDRSMREAHNDALQVEVDGLNQQVKDLKSVGRTDDARALMEKIENIKDQEYIPFFFNFPSDAGIPGIYGTILDTIADPIKDITGGLALPLIGAPQTTQYHWSDFLLSLQLAGIGQSDVNRVLRQIQKIEEEQWRQQKDNIKRQERQERLNPGSVPINESDVLINL